MSLETNNITFETLLEISRIAVHIKNQAQNCLHALRNIEVGNSINVISVSTEEFHKKIVQLIIFWDQIFSKIQSTPQIDKKDSSQHHIILEQKGLFTESIAWAKTKEQTYLLFFKKETGGVHIKGKYKSIHSPQFGWTLVQNIDATFLYLDSQGKPMIYPNGSPIIITTVLQPFKKLHQNYIASQIVTPKGIVWVNEKGGIIP